MSQSQCLSVVEAALNMAVGWLVALTTRLAVFPAMGFQVTLGQHLLVGFVFTFVSFLRSYALRRLFVRLG